VETRFLGRSGLRVSVLALGTMTFGGVGRFEVMGSQDVPEARELVSMCLDAGVNLFDTADAYSAGRSEEILGEALRGRRERALIATKAHFRMSDDPNDVGQSRHHVVRACEASLRRLQTDHIDLYQVHAFDPMTALEETLGALDDLVRSGKVGAIGCSNYSAWHLMKALGVSDRRGLGRYASQQVYYSLVGRDVEWELVPLSLDQDVGILVWSPLAGGFLSGKFRRDQEGPGGTRWESGWSPGRTVDVDQGYDIVEAVAEIAAERGVTVSQVALNYLLRKPGVTSLVIGARTREHLADNLQAATWELTEEEVVRLDAASDRPLPYPNWHQRQFNERMYARQEPG
jgi:aryl-alcohol dehydrogenase-like predicted oxidoreductase